jgi:hypothetical protein
MWAFVSVFLLKGQTMCTTLEAETPALYVITKGETKATSFKISKEKGSLLL